MPYFYTEGSSRRLLVGNVNGQLHYYDVPSVITNPCILIDADANNYNEGGQSTVCFEDVNNDNKRDLFIGNGSGGLSFFSSMGPEVSVKEASKNIDNNISIYPNPANEYLNISIKDMFIEQGEFIITNLVGQTLRTGKISSNFETISINELGSGLYFIIISIVNNVESSKINKKIIKK